MDIIPLLKIHWDKILWGKNSFWNIIFMVLSRLNNLLCRSQYFHIPIKELIFFYQKGIMSTGIVIWGTFTSVANVHGKCPNGFCPKGFWTPNEGGEGGCIDPWLFFLIELGLISKRRGERKNIRTFLSNNKLLKGTMCKKSKIEYDIELQ